MSGTRSASDCFFSSGVCSGTIPSSCLKNVLWAGTTAPAKGVERADRRGRERTANMLERGGIKLVELREREPGGVARAAKGI